MILGDPFHPSASADAENRATLSDLFARAVARHPDKIALVDPMNRESFTEGPPRSLTFAQADAIVSAIAGRLRRLNLHTDAVVAFQLPNTIESVLTLLGVLRAEMIAAPLPMLWRRAEAATALTRAGAKVFITSARIGATDHSDIGIHAAADAFPVRYVCAFGRQLPDGVIPLDDLLDIDHDDTEEATYEPIERSGNPAAHTAVVTFDVTADGIVPVARNHLELIAGGLSVFLESRREAEAVTLNATPLSSFASVALALVPWLLDAGTLVLHQPFDPATFAAQRNEHHCGTLILPGPMLARMSEGGLLSSGDGFKTLIGLWRAPERVAAASVWDAPEEMLDVLTFGEVGLLTVRRGTNGKPAQIPFGPVGAPRGSVNSVLIAEIARTEAGTVALRGPTVPRAAFPPGADRSSAPCLQIDPDGYIDTGYPCRAQHDSAALAVTGAPPGLVGVGGYRFVMREIDELAAKAGITLAALPDALTGHRLAGQVADDSGDHAAARTVLEGFGVNALIAAALRGRSASQAA